MAHRSPAAGPSGVRHPRRSSAGSSNFSRAHVPWGVDLTAAWAWRFLVIAAAAYLIARVLGF